MNVRRYLPCFPALLAASCSIIRPCSSPEWYVGHDSHTVIIVEMQSGVVRSGATAYLIRGASSTPTNLWYWREVNSRGSVTTFSCTAGVPGKAVSGDWVLKVSPRDEGGTYDCTIVALPGGEESFSGVLMPTDGDMLPVTLGVASRLMERRAARAFILGPGANAW